MVVVLEHVFFIIFIRVIIAAIGGAAIHGGGWDTPLTFPCRQRSVGNLWLGVIVFESQMPSYAGAGADGTKLMDDLTGDEIYVVVVETKL
jgi:hypothetical protein